MAKSGVKPSKEEVKAMIKFKKERKKLDILLKKGKISQAVYNKRLQKIAPKGQQIPGLPMQQPPPMAPMPPPMPGGGLPHQQAMALQPQAPQVPQVPITPSAQEEIPKVGKPLAISSNDIEVVECFQCGGLITVTAPQRPIIVECPSCSAKGEVEKVVDEKPSFESKKVTASEAEFASPTFSLEDKEPPGTPEFGTSLDMEAEKPEIEDTPSPEPTVETPTVEEDNKSKVIVHERPATVEYDESMYESSGSEAIYEQGDLSSAGIMDFGSAKEDKEEEEDKPEHEVKTPSVSVEKPTVEKKIPTPTASVKPTVRLTLKPKVKKDDE